jgi:ribosome-associated toxin RatA of RatAB toxin-antitoxin module
MQRKAALGLILLGIAVFRCSGACLSAASVVLTESEKGSYRVEGQFAVAASSPAVWATLTDYDHISEFVVDMESSRVAERRKKEILVEQKFRKRFLFFYKNCEFLLSIRETPYEEIAFEDTLKGCFSVYRGSWRLEEFPGGTRVFYHLDTRSDLPVPSILTKNSLREGVEELLEHVAREIVKRADRGRSAAPALQ